MPHIHSEVLKCSFTDWIRPLWTTQMLGRLPGLSRWYEWLLQLLNILLGLSLKLRTHAFKVKSCVCHASRKWAKGSTYTCDPRREPVCLQSMPSAVGLHTWAPTISSSLSSLLCFSLSLSYYHPPTPSFFFLWLWLYMASIAPYFSANTCLFKWIWAPTTLLSLSLSVSFTFKLPNTENLTARVHH